MPFLKLLAALVVAALAVTLGVVAVAILAVGLVAYLVARMIRRQFGKPSPRATLPPQPHAVPRSRGSGEDVIEVTATEVPTERR
jgi:uncharacterized protein (DUF58 family)